jgi:ATP-dependent DNA helicase RecG
MLGDEELSRLLTDLESYRTERKSSLADTDKIKQAICAFANDLPGHGLPGVIFIGVNDDGSCANFKVTDEQLLKISNARDDGNILPFPSMTVEKRVLDNCEMVVVVVEPSYNAPVRYNQRVWIRVGPRQARATPDDERRLSEKRRTFDLPFDQRPVQGADLGELDLDFFQREYLHAAIAPDVLEENGRLIEQQLMSLRFITKDGTPTVAAILVFGKDPLNWIPGAYTQFLRIDGKELIDPIRHQKEIRGSLYDQLRLLDEILDANISISSDIQAGSFEIKQPDYPIVALQQLCRNAVLHRNYESSNSPVRIYWFNDRIEIHSPGELFGQVNESNFGEGATDYRNPSLAEAMKALGFVQRFGMGLVVSKKELEKNGNPKPDFQFEKSGVLAIVRRRP